MDSHSCDPPKPYKKRMSISPWVKTHLGRRTRSSKRKKKKEMKPGSSIFTLILTVVMLISSVDPGISLQLLLSEEAEFSRHDFPPDFIFGAGTSAYQVEGAVAEDGRSPSIWDAFTQAGGMADRSTADVTSDGYHKHKEDVMLMADTGLDSYRFSISWSRLIPDGRGAVNPKGLQFYNSLIDELLKYGIEPHVTLHHLDLPKVLEDEYEGWLSPKIIDDFTAYADVCFREFGDRVPRWTTIDEPNVMAVSAYDNGLFPPNRCSDPFCMPVNCSAGNSTTEPYIAFHNALLSHASVYNLYKSKYQATQNGWVGINVYTFWYHPFTNSASDVEASHRAFDFGNGWVLKPLVFGDYPETMKKIVGSRLPAFTESQSEQLKGAFDYIGVNHYTSLYAKDNPIESEFVLRDYTADYLVQLTSSRDDEGGQYDPTSPPAFDPAGLQLLLEHLKDAYGNPRVFIEENGYATTREESGLNDTARIDYLRAYIGSALQAIRKGANVKGYFVWSFLDVFEFLFGYQQSYGLYQVDFDDKNLTRRPRLSARWYSNLIKKVDMKITERTTRRARTA